MYACIKIVYKNVKYCFLFFLNTFYTFNKCPFLLIYCAIYISMIMRDMMCLKFCNDIFV